MLKLNAITRLLHSNINIASKRLLMTSCNHLCNKSNLIEGDILTSTKSQSHEHKKVVSGVYRCSVNNPIEHDSQHVSKFYKIDESEYEKLVPNNDFLQKDFLREAKSFKELCLMIRKPSIEIINYIRSMDFTRPIYKFILYGNFENTGRKSTAFHVMHYAMKNNWLLITVPKGAEPIRYRNTVAESSSYKENRFDTPIQAARFLKTFSSQNKELLEKLNLRTTKEYVWSAKEKTPPNTSYLDLIEFSKTRPKYASDICAILLKEIKQFANEGKFKCLVTINELNALFGKTRLFRKDKTEIITDDVTMIRSFKKLLNNDWTNAVLIGIVNEAGHIIQGVNRQKRFYDNTIEPSLRRRKESKLHYEGPLTPIHLLGKEGFYALEPFVPIEVPKYSNDEITSHFEYYKDRNWLQNALALDDDAKQELIFLSGKNPLQFRRVCSTL